MKRAAIRARKKRVMFFRVGLGILQYANKLNLMNMGTRMNSVMTGRWLMPFIQVRARTRPALGSSARSQVLSPPPPKSQPKKKHTIQDKCWLLMFIDKTFRSYKDRLYACE